MTFLSTVSGGGWAGSLYQYAPYDDHTLLGPPLPDAEVGKLRWEEGSAPYNLDILDAHAIGHLCTRIGWDSLVQGAVDLWWDYNGQIPASAYWPRLIGRILLQPYGLGDELDSSGKPTKYYGPGQWWFDIAVRKNNPDLSAGKFYFGRGVSSLWLANSTFSLPVTNPIPYPFWQSELDAGIYPQFPGQGLDGSDLGGGSIDPFTFGSTSPVSLQGGFFTVQTPSQYALSDTVGTSSAAFGVELFARLPSWLQSALGDVTPEYDYWPVMKTTQPAARYHLSDGAGLDNQAICGVLGWTGVETILGFVNTDTPITIDQNLPVWDINGMQMDSTIPPLFGWVWDSAISGYRRATPYDGSAWYVQVFEPGSFGDLIRELRASIGTGGAAIGKIKTHTVNNDHFGVGDARPVEICFIFNHLAMSFWNQLEWEIRWGIQAEYPMVTFPYFGTLTDLNLTRHAVNLLADLMAWSVRTNEAIVRPLFGTITK